MDKLPPYNNFSYFNVLRRVLREEGVPGEVAPSWLRRVGVPGYMADRVPYDLRFLGFLAEDNSPTERLGWLLLEGEEYRERMRRVLQDAYRDFFDLEELPRLTREELLWRIKSRTGCADSTARACLSFLSAFAQEAGISGVGEPGPASRETEGREDILALKRSLLAKLPNFDSSWKPQEVIRTLELFDRFLRELEGRAR